MSMKIKSAKEFHGLAPSNATHVLRLGDKYEYANFTGYRYDSCDNSTYKEMIAIPSAANNDWCFNVRCGEWEVHLELGGCRLNSHNRSK